jgi:glyoxylate reductase
MKVLITARLPEEVVAAIRKEHHVVMSPKDSPMPREELLEKIADKDGVITMLTDKVNRELFDKAPNLKMVANFAVGFDNIDIPMATQRGIRVSNTPGVLADATADLAFALLLAVARRIVEGDKRVRSGEFKYLAPLLFLGTEVTGKTLGIVGLGGIGAAVARRARGFDMKILYQKRSRISELEEKALGIKYADLKTLLQQSDFVSLHCPLTPETRHLIGKDEFGLMKPTAILINAARGPVVDEAALVEALKSGQISGAGLDVYENEPALAPGLADLPNVVLVPHVGSGTLETRTKMAEMAARNLMAGLRGERPPNCLNCA